MAKIIKALIADDSETIRQLVRTTLTDAGIRVTTTSNGTDALSLAKQDQFDLIITDIHMPGMDGLNLVQKLRALPSCRSIPILVLTMANTDYAKQQGKAAGATGWITKPISQPSLLGLMSKLGFGPSGSRRLVPA